MNLIEVYFSFSFSLSLVLLFSVCDYVEGEMITFNWEKQSNSAMICLWFLPTMYMSLLWHCYMRKELTRKNLHEVKSRGKNHWWFDYRSFAIVTERARKKLIIEQVSREIDVEAVKKCHSSLMFKIVSRDWERRKYFTCMYKHSFVRILLEETAMEWKQVE